ncbi:DHA2 family efflux MFS transporter permease subunit [Solirubrobacter ginsenosidimutans]|uniref:DHA2 family efflux MFS transporter permease subunit n=1 Tax=Solirubrobacter ginsenosidimutans TaxID=490573 RepID=A0A9X3S0J4_9ACTN|nr:DHA2 family efflux MFS transporter permease subunit [Solirubrobacter ginsenosidimutans]MDA0160157.1 DHA2 family efflux MFS transporter permease subunit [Solirubrobacter ginsenosidimutans]
MPPATSPYAQRWKALGVLALSLFVVTVGNTILNVGLPTIRNELGASSSQLQWIVDGYLLVFAGLLLTAGSLGDRFGRRRALVTGLLVFAAGSALAALSGSSSELIASRALMGLGAAGIMPTTLSILTNIFPAQERAKAIAAWAAVSGLGIAAGPISGGWLLEHFSWNSMFLVNLPIVAIALAGVALVVPDSRDPAKPRLDLAGVAFSITGLGAIVWGLIEAPERGWGDPAIVGAFALGIAVLTAFVAWERHTAHPMLDVRVFRNLRFSAASLSVTFVFFSLMGVLFFLTSYMQAVLGYTPLGTGVRVLPVAFGLVAASKLSVKLVQRVGTKLVVAGGLVTVASALSMYTGFGVDTGYPSVALALLGMGAGMGLAMAPATEAIMGALPKAKAGVGSAMNDVVREVGGTLGVAVLGSFLSSGFSSAMDGSVAGLSPEQAHAASDSVGAAHEVASHLDATAASTLIDASNQAFVDAMATTATIAAAVALIGALIAVAFLPSRARSTGLAAGAALPAVG